MFLYLFSLCLFDPPHDQSSSVLPPFLCFCDFRRMSHPPDRCPANNKLHLFHPDLAELIPPPILPPLRDFSLRSLSLESLPSLALRYIDHGPFNFRSCIRTRDLLGADRCPGPFVTLSAGPPPRPPQASLSEDPCPDNSFGRRFPPLYPHRFALLQNRPLCLPSDPFPPLE